MRYAVDFNPMVNTAAAMESQAKRVKKERLFGEVVVVIVFIGHLIED